MDYYIEKIKYHNPIASELVWIRRPWKYNRNVGGDMGWGLVLGSSFERVGEDMKYRLLWEVYFYGEILYVSRDDIQRFMWWNRHILNPDGSPRLKEAFE